MDGLKYCRDRVLVPGSSLNLTRHFIDPEFEPRLVVLYAFYGEIASIPEQVSDESVAHSKLGWWQDEITRCWQGSGRHPVSLALSGLGLTQQLVADDLLGLVAAVSQWMDAAPLAREADLLQHCRAIGGMAARLEARLSDIDNVSAVERLGTAHYLVALVRDLGMDVRAGRWYIPMDLQARFQYTRDQAIAADAATLPDLAGHLLDTATQGIQQGLSLMSAAEQRAARHLVIQAALDLALIKKLLARPARILQHRVRLSPMASLWTVWRAARRPGFD